jgi:hypothetical protein
VKCHMGIYSEPRKTAGFQGNSVLDWDAPYWVQVLSYFSQSHLVIFRIRKFTSFTKSQQWEKRREKVSLHEKVSLLRKKIASSFK